MEKSTEWGMVLELMTEIRSIDSEAHQEFITSLYLNLDPHAPFLDQQSQKQRDYLQAIYDKYLNEDDEAFEDFE